MKYFCPNCHREIILPEYINKIKSENWVKIQCANCKEWKIIIQPLDINKNTDGS